MKNIKAMLKEGKVCLGTWIQIGSPTVAELMARQGFDWAAIDLEHTEITMDKVADIFRGFKNTGTAPMARVVENDTMAIRRVLDCGAAGVIVPLVNNAEDARRAVAAAKYPPEGIRGYAFCRPNEWGEDFDEYVKTANEEIAVIVMIESKEAVENIDAILDVEGVDGIFIGPYDMSGSYGVPGQTSHPLVTEGCKKVLEACKRHHKAPGMHNVLPNAENVRQNIEDGYLFLALGIDTVFLKDGLKEAVTTARDVLRG